jgi:peptidoglycan/LPS O-acetylase OafA/YrhL
MCYSVYLYHLFIVHNILPATVRLFPPVHALWWDAGVQFVLLLVPVFGISAVIFVFTERPFMLLSHEVARRSRPAATVQSVGA